MSRQLKDIAHRASVDFLMKNIPFLACLSEEEAGKLRDIIVDRQFAKNETILHEEDTPNYFYFIYSGEVKVVQLSADGKERIIAIHKRGDYFGEMAILDGKTVPATVVAMENTKIGLISKEHFENHLMGHERVLKEIIGMLCSRLRGSWMMLKVLSFADAEQRLRAVLKNMGDQFGVQDARGIVIDLRLTHSEIANLASISRETATRILNRLEKSQEIEILEGKHILMKPAFNHKTESL